MSQSEISCKPERPKCKRASVVWRGPDSAGGAVWPQIHPIPGAIHWAVAAGARGMRLPAFPQAKDWRPRFVPPPPSLSLPISNSVSPLSRLVELAVAEAVTTGREAPFTVVACAGVEPHRVRSFLPFSLLPAVRNLALVV